MKPSHALLRGSVVVIAAAVMLGATAHSAPKKPEPQPATEETPAPKKAASGKKKAAPAAPAPESKPAPGPKAAKAKPVSESAVKSTTKVSPQEKSAPLEDAAPEKKGFMRKLFGKKKSAESPTEAEADAEPKLAKAKTVKPAPVKEVKPVKSVRSDEILAKSEEEEAPKKKRGLFGFFRRDRSSAVEDGNSGATIPDEAKTERPADWQERSIVKDDDIALYEYGPSQTNGPDARLGRGTLVKVNQIQRGWALVAVEGGRSGYIDAAALRSAAKDDFRDPVIPAMASASVNPAYWAPAAPPPDLPDQPGTTDNGAALLLLPPLELEPKP